MKRLISIFLFIFLLGAGCVSPPPTSTVARSSWFLTRADNQPLYAFTPYWQSRVDFPAYPERSRVDGNDRVWLQTVPEPVRVDNYTYKEKFTYYPDEDWIVFDTIIFDKKATMPSNAELRQIGNNTIGVIPNGNGVFTMFFLQTESGLFQIIPYYGSDVTEQQMEEVIGQLVDNT